jgi:hypothetical protein
MLKFERNMAGWDRALRFVVGISLLVVGPATNLVELAPVLENILAVVGVFAILSATFAYCLLYEFTGSNTLKG